MANSFQSYALALLTLVRNQEDVNDNPPLGIAIRRDSDGADSSFNMPAHDVLRLLIVHSPSPETIARLFMVQLARCEIPAVKNLVNILISSDRSVNPGDWALAVREEIRPTGGIMKPLTDLATFSLNCVIGFRKSSLIKAPQYSVPRTPNPTLRNSFLEELAAFNRHKADLRALRDLIIRRDGPHCLVTGYPFVGRGRVVACKSTHIIPFSIHDKPILRYAIEMFTGRQLRTENIQHLINHPANVVNIEYNAHESMVRKMAWGIEARSVNNERKYYFRVVKPDYIYATIQLNDGDEIEFGRGNDGGTIALPDPRACNLHLAIARVFAASGAAEVVDKYLEDLGDDPPAVPIHFGRSTIADEILVRGLGVAT